MKCDQFRELLPLYIEGDLQEKQGSAVDDHLMECPNCRSFAARLRESQSVVKSLRQDWLPQTDVLAARQSVLARVCETPSSLDWTIRFERAILAGFKQKYALAGLAVIVMVSAAVFGMMWTSGWTDPTVNEATGLREIAPRQFAVELPDSLAAIPVPELKRAVDTVPSTRVQEHQHPESVLAEKKQPKLIPSQPPPVLVEAFGLFEPPQIQTMDLSLINAGKDDRDQFVIKVVTEDPAVIIQWLADRS